MWKDSGKIEINRVGNIGTNNTRQAAWVAVGNLFSFMVGILSPMILSRFFDKADYGTYKQVMYVYNTLLAVFTLGLPKAYAYFIPKFERKYSKDIINKITRIFWTLGLAFAALLYFGSTPISKLLANPELDTALKLFAPVPLFLLPTMGLDNICASFQRTKVLAFYTITTRIFTVLCTILPVLIWKGNYLHAILGFDFACIITCLLALYIKNKLTSDSIQEISALKLKEILRFSIPLLTASLWGMVISSSTQFFISRYYGNDVFADFSNGFMELPFVGMIIGAIATVLLPAFSKMDTGEGISQDTLKLWTSSLIKSAKIIFPMLIYCIFFAEIIMTCMYGDHYATSSYYFIIKNFSGLFYVIPFVPIILAIGRTKEYSRVHMLIAVLIVLLEFFAVKYTTSPVIVAAVSELCQILKIILLFRIICGYAKSSINQLLPLRQLTKVIIQSILSAVLPCIIIYLFDMNKFVGLSISFILYILVYYVLCFLFKTTYRDIASSFIKSKSSARLVRFLP